MPYRGVRVRSRPRWSLPLLASVSISGSTPAGSVLTATVTMANIPMPRSTTVTVEWYRNASNSTSGGTLITTQASVIAIANPAEGQTSTFTYTTVDADIGDFIYAIAYARNARGTGAPSVTSGTIGAVTGVAPVISSVSISGTFSEGNTVSASPTYSTVGHPTPSETYQWQYSTDGSTGWTNISAASSSSFTISDVTYAGYFLRCQVTATNSVGSSGPISSAASARVGTLYFGNGSDGDVTLGSTQTITSGKQYRNLTIGTGVVVSVGAPGTSNSLLQVCRTLTMANPSTIAANGVDGVQGTGNDSSGGSDQPGGLAQSGGPGGGGASGAGGTFHHTGPVYDNGQNGSGPGGSVGSDGDGANGSAGSASSGGSGFGSNAASNPTTKAHVRDNTSGWCGGGGGGGGGAIASCIKGCSYFAGPSGGSGGGFLRVLAATVSASSSALMTANGGNGPTYVSTLWSGGGGGGRVAFATYDSSQSAGLTLQANGGTSGTSGTAGTAGNTISLVGTGP